MGDDTLPVRLHAEVLADRAGPGHLLGGGARQVHCLRAHLIRFPRPRPSGAHVE